MRGRWRRGVLAAAAAALVLQTAAAPAARATLADAPAADHGGSRLSQGEAVLAATCFGAGLGLVVASQLVEGRYERVTGYRTIGDREVPVVTRGGSDDGMMLALGLGFLFLGACFAVLPAGPDDPGAPAAHAAAAPRGFRVAAPRLAGTPLAVGVAHAF